MGAVAMWLARPSVGEYLEGDVLHRAKEIGQVREKGWAAGAAAVMIDDCVMMGSLALRRTATPRSLRGAPGLCLVLLCGSFLLPGLRQPPTTAPPRQVRLRRDTLALRTVVSIHLYQAVPCFLVRCASLAFPAIPQRSARLENPRYYSGMLAVGHIVLDILGILGATLGPIFCTFPAGRNTHKTVFCFFCVLLCGWGEFCFRGLCCG